jgi:hypothetical protein
MLALRAARFLYVDLGGRCIGARSEVLEHLLICGAQRIVFRRGSHGLWTRATPDSGFARRCRCHLRTIVRWVRRFNHRHGQRCFALVTCSGFTFDSFAFGSFTFDNLAWNELSLYGLALSGGLVSVDGRLPAGDRDFFFRYARVDRDLSSFDWRPRDGG